MTPGLPDERLPRDFGKYRLVKKLATGGMAEIFLGHRLDTPDERVVIKRILPHLLESADFVSMFLDEARIAAQLNHPNIVQIHDVGQISGAYFIAMEYIHGEDVRRIYNQAYKLQRSLPLSHSIRVIAEAALGLDFAHRLPDLTGKPMGVVHRDVSPQNILVTYEGGVKVVDFGIAKAANKVNQTRAGVLKGKYSYMSPEQAMGDDIDQRTDIFALGIILYETTTGTRLFKRPGELQTLQAVIKCDVLPPSDALPGYPIELEEIVMRALAKKPADRYQTADALSQDLYRFLKTSGLYVEPESIAEFMADLFADRLAEEAASGQPVLPPEHESRLEIDAPSNASESAPSASAPSSGLSSRSQEIRAPSQTASERPGISGSTNEAEIIAESEPPPERTPTGEEPGDTRLSDRAQATFADERPRGPGFVDEGTAEGTLPEEDQEDIARLEALAAKRSQPPPALEPRRSEPPAPRDPPPARHTGDIPVSTTKGPGPGPRAGQKASTDQMPTVVNHAAYRSLAPEKPERGGGKVEPTEFVRSVKKNGRAEGPDRHAPPTERITLPAKNGVSRERPSVPPPAARISDRIPVPQRASSDPRRWVVLSGLGVLFVLGLALAVFAGRSLAQRNAPSGVTPIATTTDDGTGEVTIHTEPGASVLLGSKVLGKADKEGSAGPFRLPAGDQRFKVALDSGLIRERSLAVRAGGIHEIEIRARQGWLKLVVAPWARVRIDDQDVGITPLPNLPLLEGDHRIVLENPDIKRRHEVKLKIDAGRVSELKLDLAQAGTPM